QAVDEIISHSAQLLRAPPQTSVTSLEMLREVLCQRRIGVIFSRIEPQPFAAKKKLTRRGSRPACGQEQCKETKTAIAFGEESLLGNGKGLARAFGNVRGQERQRIVVIPTWQAVVDVPRAATGDVLPCSERE